MDKIDMLSLTEENKYFFLNQLKKELSSRFGTVIEDLPELYGYEKPWSLLSLIESGSIDTYQLLYVNDKIWTGSGGMIRELNGEKVYQAGFRGFSCASNTNLGLGIKTFLHDNSTKFQIERAKMNGCKSVILSFNDYNEKLFKITQRYILPKSFPKDTFIPSTEPVMFNGVAQWLLIMKL
jgi:hypothetical protein